MGDVFQKFFRLKSEPVSFMQKQEVEKNDYNFLRVLVVDDEPFNLIALEGQLLMLGISQIDKAFNGEDALK
jgi:PleD family two-component response regulator